MNADSIPFDVKMKTIRSHVSGFWIYETPEGLLEARIDYQHYTTFIGNCVYIDDLISMVYEHLYDEFEINCLDSWDWSSR